MRDLREYSKQTTLWGIFFFALILIIIGLGLVWVFYGGNAALFGLLCLIGTLIPVGLIVIALKLIDKFDRNRES